MMKIQMASFTVFPEMCPVRHLNNSPVFFLETVFLYHSSLLFKFLSFSSFLRSNNYDKRYTRFFLKCNLNKQPCKENNYRWSDSSSKTCKQKSEQVPQPTKNYLPVAEDDQKPNTLRTLAWNVSRRKVDYILL